MEIGEGHSVGKLSIKANFISFNENYYLTLLLYRILAKVL